MHRSPSFSLPTPSVEGRIARIRSKVPAEFLSNCTEKEKMILNAVDILQQQGEVAARGQDETNGILDEVVVQTKKTNGTIQNHEQRILTSEGVLSEIKKSQARRTKIMTTLIPFIVVALEISDKKLGLL